MIASLEAQLEAVKAKLIADTATTEAIEATLDTAGVKA